MIELHFWPTPNGLKASVMLEETGLPYAVRFVDISLGQQFESGFLAIAPNNRIPAIVDPDGPDGRPLALFESGAILLYLARKAGMLMPADERGRVEVEQWLMWQMGGFGPMLGQNHHFALHARERIPYAVDRYRDETRRLYSVLDGRLADRDHVAGDYSIADVACLPWARHWEKQGIDLGEFGNVARWIGRLEARPAVARGLAVGAAERAASAARADQSKRALLYGQRGRG